MKTLIYLSILMASPAFAVFSAGQLYNGKNLSEDSLEVALAKVKAGTIVVLGEQHGTMEQAKQQSQIIEIIRNNQNLTSVGMEFFEYPQQAMVEDYFRGVLNESDFLKNIGWGGFSFDAYREQVRSPTFGSEFLLALNAPRALTGRIAKVGLDQLTSSEQSLLPPNFTLGNARYFERFKDSMGGGHVSDPKAIDRYFAAQSTWDDTMAYQATQFIKNHPEQVLVIIVGEFHVQYGGGLPARLRARGAANVTTFSLLNQHGLSSDEIIESMRPAPLDGPRADWILLSDIPH